MFEITEKGRARVRTPEFCDEVEAFVLAGLRDGMDEDMNDAGLVALVACTFVGIDFKDLENLPDSDLKDLEQFMLKNADEINAAIDYCQKVSLTRLQERRVLRDKAQQIWPSLRNRSTGER